MNHNCSFYRETVLEHVCLSWEKASHISIKWIFLLYSLPIPLNRVRNLVCFAYAPLISRWGIFLPATCWGFLFYFYVFIFLRNTCLFAIFLKSSNFLLYIAWNYSFLLSDFILPWSLILCSYFFWGFPESAIQQLSWSSFLLDPWINSTSVDPITCPSWFPNQVTGIHIQITSQKGGMETKFLSLACLNMREFFFLRSWLIVWLGIEFQVKSHFHLALREEIQWRS